MTMFEEAAAMAGTLRLCGITQEELADRLHVSQSYVANKLRLLKYSAEQREAILASGLSERHARAILRLSEERSRSMAIRRAREEGLSVAMTERLVDMLLTTEEEGEQERIRVRALHYLQTAIADAAGLLSSIGIRTHRVMEESSGETRIILSFCK